MILFLKYLEHGMGIKKFKLIFMYIIKHLLDLFYAKKNMPVERILEFDASKLILHMYIRFMA